MSSYAFRHRPVMAGLKIQAARTPQGSTSPIGKVGTLTGLATRNSDDKRVLVACRAART